MGWIQLPVPVFLDLHVSPCKISATSDHPRLSYCDLTKLSWPQLGFLKKCIWVTSCLAGPNYQSPLSRIAYQVLWRYQWLCITVLNLAFSGSVQPSEVNVKNTWWMLGCCSLYCCTPVATLSTHQCLCLVHSFPANSVNIVINYIPSETRIFDLHLCINSNRLF